MVGVRDAVLRVDARHLGHADRQEQRRLVQHLVVLEVRHERRRSRARILEQVHRGAGHAGDVGVERLTSDLLHRPLAAADPTATNSRPRRHVVIWITRPKPTASGNQPPVGIFGTLAARNAMSTTISGASVATDRSVDHPHRSRTTR